MAAAGSLPHHAFSRVRTLSSRPIVRPPGHGAGVPTPRRVSSDERAQGQEAARFRASNATSTGRGASGDLLQTGQSDPPLVRPK